MCVPQAWRTGWSERVWKAVQGASALASPWHLTWAGLTPSFPQSVVPGVPERSESSLPCSQRPEFQKWRRPASPPGYVCMGEMSNTRMEHLVSLLMYLFTLPVSENIYRIYLYTRILLMGSELKSSVTESRGTTVCRLGLLRPQASLANTWRKDIKAYWGNYWY